MYQEPEHDDYDDDDYNYYPEHSGDDYSEYTKKFNIDWAAWEQWLSKTIKEIAEEDNNVWVFGHKLSDKTEKKSKTTFQSSSKLTDKTFIYIGNNKDNDAVWKKKYLAKNQIQIQYNNHISCHASYYLMQPAYYKGMFDILN